MEKEFLYSSRSDKRKWIMNVTVIYKTSRPVSPGEWVYYNAGLHVKPTDTIDEVASSIKARKYTDKHGDTHAKIYFELATKPENKENK